MKFKNVRPTDFGIEYDVEMTKDEAAYLTSFAVERLLQEGIIAISAYESEQEVELRETSH